MLFDIYWGSIGEWGNTPTQLASIIKEAPPEDAFFVITVNYQEAGFKKWLNDYEVPLKYKTPYKLTNKVHVNNGRNMTLWVLGNGGEITPKEYTAPVRRPRQLKLL